MTATPATTNETVTIRAIDAAPGHCIIADVFGPIRACVNTVIVNSKRTSVKLLVTRTRTDGVVYDDRLTYAANTEITVLA